MPEPRFLDQALFAQLGAQAAANPRLRQHHNFHQMDEPCHRLAVGLQPGVRPGGEVDSAPAGRVPLNVPATRAGIV